MKKVYKFYKNDCSGCYALSRSISSIKNKIEDFEIVELNIETEENKSLARSYGLSSVPALVRVWDGKILTGGKNNGNTVLEFLKGE